MLSYLKTHKLSSLLILIVLYLLWRTLNPGVIPLGTNFSRNYATDMMAESGGLAMGAPEMMKSSSLSILPPYEPDTAPQAGIDDRLVVRESNLSLVVNNVRQTVDQIISQANQIGGYMVSSSLNQPEEAPFATVIVRVPSERLGEVLEAYRGLAIKVTSENLTGTDVTDQYIDINTRLERLRATQSKIQQLLNQAVEFEDILRANQEIINLQNQIDNLIGQQKYLEQTAQLARLTIYLSTDELALPYAPTDTFRPAVIFKLAVRSLVQTFRSLLEFAIWAGVYSAIWLPALVILYFTRRWWLRQPK